MAMQLDSGYFDPSLTSVGSGYADLVAGSFGADDHFVAADADMFADFSDVDDQDDLQDLISLGLHMSD